MAYILDKLTTQHDTAEFSCGQTIFDEWLMHNALDAQNRKTTTVYVWRVESYKVVAFFALSSQSQCGEVL